MFSIADMAVAGAVALLLFGPDQLPKVARRAGQLVRDVQNTSQSFIREMERAADTQSEHEVRSSDPFSAATLPAAPAYHETPEPAAHERVLSETALGRHADEAEAAPGAAVLGTAEALPSAGEDTPYDPKHDPGLSEGALGAVPGARESHADPPSAPSKPAP